MIVIQDWKYIAYKNTLESYNILKFSFCKVPPTLLKKFASGLLHFKEVFCALH